jgi:amino acid adenylation domain-containing protein
VTRQHEDPAGTRLRSFVPPGPAPAGSGGHEVAVPTEVATGMARLAGATGAGRDDVLLAVHSRVVATLTADREVRTGFGSRTVRVSVGTGSWRDLIARAAGAVDVETAPDVTLLVHEPAGRMDPGGDTVLTVEWIDAGDGRSDARLRLSYRRDTIAPEYAERIGGYYLAALTAAVAEPDAPHARRSLLSDAEVRTHLHDLAGPRREIPARSLAGIFEERVAADPDLPAAGHGARRWTYRELDDRANAIAHTLLARGVGAEDVVAVVADRTLDWVATTIAIFKVGGVYLPVRPDFPPERIATQLRRSRCRHLVTEAAAAATVERTLATLGRDCDVVTVDDIPAGGHGNPDVPVLGDQAAYIYFTSGSTGEPKGAVCEHRGMLNHLYAKIEDLDLKRGEVVSQTASQCFDISLWQVVAPLLVGGSVQIIDTATQLDVEAFLYEVVARGVDVAQLVPSYFDVLVSHLERHPRDLGRLRMVSITGEAFKLEPVRRWLALYPAIPLVNAYGATEVSDDTMHEILDRVPERGFVSVGRSLRNVDTYILDENLRLAPLGSPGEIVFAGVCVGRGYVNDPDRTCQAFVADPYRTGARMYRTGDFGRWLPEGRIEFLGRRDHQVKIRGFRIEIGEIEGAVRRVPGVGDAVVVVDGGHLVAFYTAGEVLPLALLRERLAASLPEYMVPAYFHRLDRLPLTENGKVDRPALTRLATTIGPGGLTGAAPATPTEYRLATAWAEALNVPVERVGRDDDFFALGGTSLAAVRLVVKLDRLISLKQLVRRPVLADLAAAIDAAAVGAAADQTAGALLQPQNDPARVTATLVCFPYAGGNAMNFRTLGRELEPHGVAVYGVELPGHDFAGTEEPLAGVADVAGQAAAEITALVGPAPADAGAIDTPSGPLLLWGHCAGAAHALACARRLETAGLRPHRVFVGALMLDDPDQLALESAEVSALSNRDITARLLEDSAYVELDGLKPERVDLVGSAYRHDVCSTNRYLTDVQGDPAAHRVGVPVEVVVATDDPTTKGYERRHRAWAGVTGPVTLRVLDGGGHYFVRTRPAEVAALVAAARTD